MTGSSDGVVRMWSLQFVQVPDESAKHKKKELATTKSTTTSKVKDNESNGKGNANEKDKRAEDGQNLNSIQNRFKGARVI